MAWTTWRSWKWASWIGWTLVFALVAGACALAYGASTGCKRWPKGLRVVADACEMVYQMLGPAISPVWSLAYLVPPLVAAFLIGVRFPFRWWPLGPPVALFLAGTPLLLVPSEVAASLVPESYFHDLEYAEALFLSGLFLLFGMTIFLVLLTLVAHAGVRLGRRREGGHSR